MPIRAWKSLSPQQRRSGIAGWLGWMFDGLDMHLYTIVATVFVAQLLHVPESDPDVGTKGAIIQACFLAGWALGGAFFGIIGDRIGRSRALMLTILTYSLFCGLSALATQWWHLAAFRFLSALGIGGEWAVGAALLSESLPKHWRPWIAAILQTGVNVGILLAALTGILMKGMEPRWVFVVGVLPALITLWIRKAVPETEEWTEANAAEKQKPRISALFAPGQAHLTWLALIICGLSLTAHWAFMFWQQRVVKLHPDVVAWGGSAGQAAVSQALIVIIVASIAGNFLAGWSAAKFGYARTTAVFFVAYVIALSVTFTSMWSFSGLMVCYACIGVCQGVFGLFTMSLPPLFPVLLRTTGAGFCYNIGRLASAAGVVLFGIFNKEANPGLAVLYAGFLFIPAAVLALRLPQPADEGLAA